MTTVVDHAQRRRKILEGAMELFADHGYGGVTYQKIADRCGIARTAIYRYFNNKRELFVYAVNMATRQLDTRYREILNVEDLSAEERLRRILHETVETLFEHRVFLRVVLEYLLGRRQAGSDIRRRVRRHSHVLRVLLRRLVEEGVESGEFVPVDGNAVASVLFGILESAGLRATLTDPEGCDEVRATVDSALRVMRREA